MGKAPAFQFYVKDWLSDPLLQQASPISRGVWINLLCYMWEADKRGMLESTPLKLMRLGSASLDEVNHFLNDIKDLEFGDVETEENVTFPIMEHNCNMKVTLINRRMYADYKDKENTRLRVKKHREAKKVKQKGNGEGNEEITPSSSSPSPSSSPKQTGQPPSHFEFHVGEFLDDILSSCEKINRLQINKKNKFNPYMWVQVQVNNSGHPQAILESLEGLIKYWNTTDNPWTYANKIIISKSKNYYEAGHIKQHREFKEAFEIDPRVKELLKPIGEK